MERVTKSDIRKHRWLTWFGFALIAGFCALLGPIGYMAATPMLLIWWHTREQGLRVLEVRYGKGLGHEIAQMYRQWDTVQTAMNSYMGTSVFGAHTVACRTCGSPTEQFMNKGTLCWNNFIPKHTPFEEPPKPNPYRNFRFQLHGQEPPPDNWPEGTLYVHPYAGEPNYLEIAIARGKQYWLKHDNWAWDNGFGDPPDWYVEARLKRVS